MTTRYWVETECEHGSVEGHPTVRDETGYHWENMCPGGLRRELTGVEERSLWSWSESGIRRQMEPGRYLVIPLEESADG